MATLTRPRLGQLRQLRRLDPAAARAALTALSNGLPSLADETIRQGMQNALTRMAAHKTETESKLGPVIPPDCTPGETLAAMLGADITAERKRQESQRIARPTGDQAEAMLRVALGAGGGSGLNVNRWSFSRR